MDRREFIKSPLALGVAAALGSLGLLVPTKALSVLRYSAIPDDDTIFFQAAFDLASGKFPRVEMVPFIQRTSYGFIVTLDRERELRVQSNPLGDLEVYVPKGTYFMRGALSDTGVKVRGECPNA